MTQIKQKRLVIRSLILLVLLGAVGYTLYSNLTKASQGEIHVGQTAPDFVLKDMNGKTHQLSHYRGKGVFLNFWGTWCDPCKREMPYMNDLYEEYHKKGVEILAVHVKDTRYLVENFIKQYGLQFPVMIDKDGDVQNEYGIDPLPESLLIGPDGRVKKIIIGNQNLKEKDFRSLFDSIKP
ncbi:thiol-disulfide oxidoreductase ResA [Heyndrickxia acidicola]|uniref:Thiol-disulfide oxidoreductase ResA n=1 Tax=Heyndrickxia acidicola TaxID=209389 RepID=A0ABU6MK71_9BACI|nr:thiol-disulfide oxidoreductase ResA [Heyndrickxia acidicola]MED1204920.1 thiol-disulfide oxidoreductase ResA [Heyndrickxia acidicola]